MFKFFLAALKEGSDFMPSEEKGLIPVSRTKLKLGITPVDCFLPIKGVSWRVSPKLIEKAKQQAPGWKDDTKIGSMIAHAVPTRDIKTALTQLYQAQPPRDEIILPPKRIHLSFPGRNRGPLVVRIKVIKDCVEIHPHDSGIIEA